MEQRRGEACCMWNGLHTVSIDKNFFTEPKINFGENAGKIFLDDVMREASKIPKYITKVIPMETLSEEMKNLHNQSISCNICEKDFQSTDTKVRDHCHIAGNFLS